MGVNDISAEVHGSTNPINVLQAFMKALRRQKTPEDVARETGMRIFDVQKLYEQASQSSLMEGYN